MRFNSSLWLHWTGLLIGILFLNACVSDQCETQTESKLKLRFAFAKYTNAERTTEQALPVSFTKITATELVAGVKPFLEDTSSITGVLLPLSPSKNTTTFILQRKSLDDEEITFTYTPKPYFISQACGFEIKYENIKVSDAQYTNITEVVVVQPSLNAQR